MAAGMPLVTEVRERVVDALGPGSGGPAGGTSTSPAGTRRGYRWV